MQVCDDACESWQVEEKEQEQEDYMGRVTLEQAEGMEKKKAKKEKGKAAFGWDIFNQDSLYNAHKKRLAKVPSLLPPLLSRSPMLVSPSFHFLSRMKPLNRKPQTPNPPHRLRQMQVDLEGYQKQKEEQGTDIYRDANSLAFGSTGFQPSQEKVESMVNDLLDKQEKRNKFSRRRGENEDDGVDYINDRNKHFNKKIERAFGEYTKVIKENLERGTAI